MKEEIFNGMRIILLLLLITIIIYDFEIPVVLNTQTNQMIIGIIVIFTIIVIDEIIGFLIGIIFLVIYFKHYQKIFNTQSEIKKPLLNDYNDNFVGDVKPPTNTRIPVIENEYIKMDNVNGCYEMPYISNELLEKAQTNIYDISNYNNEIRINDNTYGVQGLNSDGIHFPAFDNSDIIYNRL